MCNFKSFVLTPNLGVHWCEDDKHHVIINRLNIKDISEFGKSFLLLTVINGKMKNYQLDNPPDMLPLWYVDHEREYKNKVRSILKQIMPIWAKEFILIAAKTGEIISLTNIFLCRPAIVRCTAMQTGTLTACLI